MLYEVITNEILSLRKLSNEELSKLFQSDRHVYVNSAYEWDYYVSTLFQSAGVLDKTDGELICKLQHGNTNTFRKVTRNCVSIPDNLKDIATQLLSKSYNFV